MNDKTYSLTLLLGFILSILLVAVLGILAAYGQEHAFPFKTLTDMTTGTEAWVMEGPPDLRTCPGIDVILPKFQYKSKADSVWTVYTDGKLFAAAYFPPGSEKPVAVVVGHIKDGEQVVVESDVPYDPEKHHPCDRWLQKET